VPLSVSVVWLGLLGLVKRLWGLWGLARARLRPQLPDRSLMAAALSPPELQHMLARIKDTKAEIDRSDDVLQIAKQYETMPPSSQDDITSSQETLVLGGKLCDQDAVLEGVCPRSGVDTSTMQPRTSVIAPDVEEEWKTIWPGITDALRSVLKPVEEPVDEPRGGTRRSAFLACPAEGGAEPRAKKWRRRLLAEGSQAGNHPNLDGLARCVCIAVLCPGVQLADRFRSPLHTCPLAIVEKLGEAPSREIDAAG